MIQRWAWKKTTCVDEQVNAINGLKLKIAKQYDDMLQKGYELSLSVKVKKSQGNRKGIFLEGKQLINTVANFQIAWYDLCYK